MDSSSRPRSNTLSVDTSSVRMPHVNNAPFRRARKVSGGGIIMEDIDESLDFMNNPPQAKAAAISNSTNSSYEYFEPPRATPRGRSRTNADTQRPMSMLYGRYLANQRAANVGTAGGSAGLAQRYGDEGPAPAAARGIANQYNPALTRNGNWCDVERKNLAAYEYLCHVSEAKEWIEACIDEDLPDILIIEDSLRDGVALAKLARTFCPEVVGKIYEKPPSSAGGSGNVSAVSSQISSGVRQRFVFKFTDNINFFLSAIRRVRLPRLFHFELTDLYDRKNMPRVIYCLHALSHFLLKMGIAPEMRDLVGHLEFSEAQLAQTQAELDNLGAKLPAFHLIDSSIGNRRPRLSREVMPMKVDELFENDNDHNKDEYSSDSEPESEEDCADDRNNDHGDDRENTTVTERSLGTRQKSVYFKDNVTFLDDPNIDRMEKAKLYWQKRIDIVLQFQCSARQRLAERLVEEKRQARRYLRMVNSSIVMQSMARMEKAEAEQRRLQEEAEAEEQRIEQAMRERARKERERVDKEKADRANAAREHQERLEAERFELERRIVGLQALVRGRLARKVFDEMRGWTAAIVRFQALCRGNIVRNQVGARLSTWGRVEHGVKQVQALCRGFLVRRRIKERRTHLDRNINVIVKMQNMYRAKLAGKAYRTLTVEDTPPTPKLVQSCAPLLEDTDQDLEEELELERLRQKAVRQIRENQQTSRVLDQLDIKIALLVRNRISLDEIVHQTKRHFRFLEELRRPASMTLPGGGLRSAYTSLGLANVAAAASNSLYSLKNMDKESRKRLEGYQNLFYLLQTQPIYLARLLFLINQGGSKAMRQSLVSNNSKAGSSGSGGMGSSQPESGDSISISKLIETIVLTLYGFAQNAREEYLLLKLFCAAIQIELSSIESLQEFLRGNPIFIKLAVHYNRGAKERKYLRDLLQPLIKKVIEDGGLDLESDPLVIYRTIIREEESRTGEKSRRAYDISREDALNDMETRTTFIRHLRQLRVLADEFIAAIQGSLDQMPYGMRKFPDEPEAQVMKIVGHLVYYRYINPAIVAPESFDVIETTISPLQRKNLAEIAKMLNQVSVGKHFSEDNMFLQPLNNYVGYTSAKFLAYSFEVTDVVDPEVHFQRVDVGSGGVGVADSERRGDQREPGDFVGPQLAGAQRPGSRNGAATPTGPPPPPSLPGEKVIRELSNLTFGELKKQVAKAMRVLETERWVERTRKSNIGTGAAPGEQPPSGPRPAYAAVFRVRRSDGYQGMLNAIARDIRTKAQRRERRRAEMRRIRITLMNLREKSDYLESQRVSYEQYLDTCTKKLAAVATQRSVRYFHLRDLQRAGRVPRFGSFKYSAEKLYYKGVIVSVDGYPPRQLDKISLTISSDQPGTFDVQDLLQLQYDNVQTMTLYEGSVVVNTNLLVFLINKKFYS
ncbi:hypothetical protein BX661DRAFT_170948 [Kickxella alabastrina]|uniref:uncharacterized protein n=1 Tax=Kickxella alabastrina TaxID=61397 RepID=UPI00221E5359|nr:uncharacterized protein BX661DRAFT_170948 [Kickxella alabastrina]KAI7827713.1 hypothetical protein BX661DRAFT_170948 [Kickxella alabastrina]